MSDLIGSITVAVLLALYLLFPLLIATIGVLVLLT